MQGEELRQFDSAVFQRGRILKKRSQEERYLDKDMGVSPAVWDGRVLSFDTCPLEDDEPTPKGWFRYGKQYWHLIK